MDRAQQACLCFAIAGATAGKTQVTGSHTNALGLEGSEAFFAQCLDPVLGQLEDLARVRLSTGTSICSLSMCLGLPTGQFREGVPQEGVTRNRHSQVLDRSCKIFSDGASVVM